MIMIKQIRKAAQKNRLIGFNRLHLIGILFKANDVVTRIFYPQNLHFKVAGKPS